ncbi:iron(III) transport system substrate-binding protein [Paenarthrobacter nicotinovorans]|uniref:extracellular solute-binding protein n=1 Tax=Micrococcaceae TaxID=1268 RepID=UPI00087742CE|nr:MULTISPECIES: extracellular solute-binding protein [Micrococcaceae]MDR6436784.1 iron(III) transport system substrate-binding protein [Paenarthrobacter nicotinovorans]SCZ56625.1 iron(III) transport system substrate-binding protein [Arthrobacter sp. UNCCL28]
MKRIGRAAKGAITVGVFALALTGCSGGSPGASSDGPSGIVQIYTTSTPTQNERFEKAFEKAHSEIDLKITRGGPDLIPRVEAEMDSGSAGADIFISTSQQWFVDNEQNLLKGDYASDWPLWGIEGLVPAIGVNPHSYIVWNTNKFPNGFHSWDSLLAPETKGTLGFRDGIDVSMSGYLQYLEDQNGPDFLEKVAAQNPVFYPTTVPLTQAVGSGEVGVAMMSSPAPILELQAAGAPVDYWLAEDGFAVSFYSAILNNSKNQAAAKVVMDFYMSPEGQKAFNGGGYGGSPLDGIEGAIDVSKMQILDPKKITPEVIAKWGERFNTIFR